MDDCRANWIECAEPGWRLTFCYPATDSAGQRVTVERRGTDPSMQAVHVMADDRDEIYFEVVRQAGTTTTEVYAAMRERIPALYEDVSFADLLVDGESAAGSFRWADQERSVRFFELDDATYRVIFRPLGTVNATILATITIS